MSDDRSAGERLLEAAVTAGVEYAEADVVRRREAIMTKLAVGMLSTSYWRVEDVEGICDRLRHAANAIMEAAE